jgi:hypothetical protein
MQHLFDRVIDQVVPRMIEWDQGHDFVEDGETVVEIMWYRSNESWFLRAVITEAADKVETLGEIEINCDVNDSSLGEVLAAAVNKELNDLLVKLQAIWHKS